MSGHYETDGLAHRFAYHPPRSTEVANRHGNVRDLIGEVAGQLDRALPAGRERALVHAKLEEAMMWANAAIARHQPKAKAPPAGLYVGAKVRIARRGSPWDGERGRVTSRYAHAAVRPWRVRLDKKVSMHRCFSDDELEVLSDTYAPVDPPPGLYVGATVQVVRLDAPGGGRIGRVVKFCAGDGVVRPWLVRLDERDGQTAVRYSFAADELEVLA